MELGKAGMRVYTECPICKEERAYEVTVEPPDWDVGAGYDVEGELVPDESCGCQLTTEQESREWEVICEKACEYPDDPY